MKPKGIVYALTGEAGGGKTMVCIQVAAEARARGLDVAGIITGRSGPEPGAARQVIDVRSGASRLFGARAFDDAGGTRSAGRSSRGAGRNGTRSLGGSGGALTDPLTPGWEFESEVFAWGNASLSTAAPCDLLIVDELGPLELLGGRGWVRALEVLRAGQFGAALVVCRPSLLDELEASLGGPFAGVFTVDPEESYELPDVILDKMFGKEQDRSAGR